MNNCPYCGSDLRYDCPVEWRCGSVSDVYRSRDCLVLEIGLLKERIAGRERELQEANERIRLLISERDSARQQADLNWKLREEFVALLGTDDVKEAVRGLKRWKAQKISTTQTK